MIEPKPGTNLGDAYDRVVGALEIAPDVLKTKVTPVRATLFSGVTQTYLVQTYRDPEQGDTILVERTDAGGSFRLALPPKVAEAIARQRRALTTRKRKRVAKETAEARMAAGWVPTFTKKE